VVESEYMILRTFYHVDSSSGGGGMMICDSDGRLLTASTKWYGYLAGTLTTEAMATKDGLLFTVPQTVSSNNLQPHRL
jgi:hypothetical protein